MHLKRFQLRYIAYCTISTCIHNCKSFVKTTTESLKSLRKCTRILFELCQLIRNCGKMVRVQGGIGLLSL